MSSKLTELTESSPSVPPPSVFCGSGILSQLASPWSMASSVHFAPGQTYDGYKAVEVLDPAYTECLAKGKDFFQHFNPKSSKFHFCFVGKKPCCYPGPADSNFRRYLWSKKDGPFGKEFQFLRALPLMLLWDILIVSKVNFLIELVNGSRQRDVARWTNFGQPISVGGMPIYSSSAVPISRITTEGVVKWVRQIADSPPDLDAEGSDEWDGGEVEVVNNPVGHQSSTYPSQPPSKRLQSHLIPSTPRNSQPTLVPLLHPILLQHKVPPTPGLL
ncbi:hypothetical protein O181_103438 [Austropuccinia psidii MF-1]|uniref:Uncharacterized protein n=1 Tax=Austropuccinia psidii MF-1 TaxID=1389203 RepID=A0A9Q3JIA2_9BASI|nr:hypothetical protein [Austropuccinia psidii MF-1]